MSLFWLLLDRDNICENNILSWHLLNLCLRFNKDLLVVQSFGSLDPDSSVVFCCDMQERFQPAISFFDEITENGNRVLKASQILGVPLVVTEQVSFLCFWNIFPVTRLTFHLCCVHVVISRPDISCLSTEAFKSLYHICWSVIGSVVSLLSDALWSTMHVL